MRWFRHRIGLGVGLSLIALALQLALTLGHTHAGELAGHDHATAHTLDHALNEAGVPDAPASDHHHGPGALCPACLVIAQAATGLTAAPPALPAPAAVTVPRLRIDAGRTTLLRLATAFQPRAPPHT